MWHLPFGVDEIIIKNHLESLNLELDTSKVKIYMIKSKKVPDGKAGYVLQVPLEFTDELLRNIELWPPGWQVKILKNFESQRHHTEFNMAPTSVIVKLFNSTITASDLREHAKTKVNSSPCL